MTAPALAVQRPDGTRIYRHPCTGEEAPSVTTVIGMINKPALVGWAAKMAAEHAVANWSRLGQLPVAQRLAEIRYAHERYTKEKSDIGDTVHSLVEFWGKGQAHSTEGITGQATQFVNFMMDVKPTFIENECTVWSRRYGYAGTCDIVAEINGETIWIDVKSGKNLHDEVGLQLAALSCADFIIREDGTEEPMPPCDGLAALHIRPRSWSLVPIRHAGDCYKAFLAAREILDWQRNVAPGVLDVVRR
jgi:hypothetical protein